MSKVKTLDTPKFWGDARSPTSGVRPSPRWYVINISEFQATLVVKQSIIKLLCRDWEIRFSFLLVVRFGCLHPRWQWLLAKSITKWSSGTLPGPEKSFPDELFSPQNQIIRWKFYFRPQVQRLVNDLNILLKCYYTISPNYDSFQEHEISLHFLHCLLVTRWKITVTSRKNWTHSGLRANATYLVGGVSPPYLDKLYMVRTKSNICITSIPAMLNPLPLRGMLSVSPSTPFPSRAPERTCRIDLGMLNIWNICWLDQWKCFCFEATFDAPPMK